MRKLYDWNAIQRCYDEGRGMHDCIAKFGFNIGSWYKAAERGDLKLTSAPFKDLRRRIDWPAIQVYYDAGNTLRQCQSKFRFSNAAWHKAVQRGEICPRRYAMPIDELLKRGVSRYNIKLRLLRNGLCQTSALIVA